MSYLSNTHVGLYTFLLVSSTTYGYICSVGRWVREYVSLGGTHAGEHELALPALYAAVAIQLIGAHVLHYGPHTAEQPLAHVAAVTQSLAPERHGSVINNSRTPSNIAGTVPTRNATNNHVAPMNRKT